MLVISMSISPILKASPSPIPYPFGSLLGDCRAFAGDFKKTYSVTSWALEGSKQDADEASHTG